MEWVAGENPKEQVTRIGVYEILLGEFVGGTGDGVHNTVRSTATCGWTPQ